MLRDRTIRTTPNRTSEPDSEADSQSRIPTNERTNGPQKPLATISHLHSATRAHVQAFDTDLVRIADVLATGILPTNERFPVSRRGERQPIPWHVRNSVWYRDGGKCQLCGYIRPRPWHLDHIVPWSAGGSDETSNLRLLCEPCNVARSNFNDRTVFAKRPATWWCHRCYGPDNKWRYGDKVTWSAFHEKHLGIWCGKYEYGHKHCRVMAMYNIEVGQGGQPSWHQRRPIEAADRIAYCAHCDVVGMTDVTL